MDFKFNEDKFDDNNALVLPSKKRKTKNVKNKVRISEPFLSKKQKKQLEKIVEKKKKKLNVSFWIIHIALINLINFLILIYCLELNTYKLFVTKNKFLLTIKIKEN